MTRHARLVLRRRNVEDDDDVDEGRKAIEEVE